MLCCAAVGTAAEGSDDEDDRQAQRAAKRWEKRAKMQRVLKQEEGDSRSRGNCFLDDDEESQSMLSMFKRTAKKPEVPAAAAKAMARVMGPPAVGLTRQASFGFASSGFGGVPAPLSRQSSFTGSFGSAEGDSQTGFPLQHKGSFIDKKISGSLAVSKKTSTVSNNRFVFQGASGALMPDAESSQSNTGSAWADHVKHQQTSAEVGEKRGSSANTAFFTVLAANRFKRVKSD